MTRLARATDHTETLVIAASRVRTAPASASQRAGSPARSPSCRSNLPTNAPLRRLPLVAARPHDPTPVDTSIALGLYACYNLAATLISVPAGRGSDRLGARGPVWILAAGVAAFALAYLGFAALDGDAVVVLGLPFVLAGFGIGCAETAEHAAVAALAPEALRGSAFGLLATIQAVGNLAASAIAGVLWTAVAPRVAFLYLAGWTTLALVGLVVSAAGRRWGP